MMDQIFCSFSVDKLEEFVNGEYQTDEIEYCSYRINRNMMSRGFGKTVSTKFSGEYTILNVGPQNELQSPCIENGVGVWYTGTIPEQQLNRMRFYHEIGASISKMLLNDLKSQNWLTNISLIKDDVACVFVDNKDVYLFRGNGRTLYVDSMLNISTVMFDGASLVPANKLFVIDFDRRIVEDTNFTI